MISFESLDITLQNRGNTIWLVLSGPFNNEEVPSINEKVKRLISDGIRNFVFDLESITMVDSEVVPMFLNLCNTIKGKGGDIKLVFKNEVVYKAFLPFINLLPVYADINTLERHGLINAIKKTRRSLSRKTGFRISKPLAAFLIVVLCGWFFSLLYIIHMQNIRIHKQELELQELTHLKEKTILEVEYLRERIRPLEQLGIIDEESE